MSEKEKKNIHVEDGDAQKAAQEEQKTVNTDKKADTEEKKADEAAKDQKEEKDQKAADPLAEAQQQVAELKDKYLRSVAEFDNYRKRTLKEKADLILNGGEKTIKAILPVVDDFERALANDKDKDGKALREGMELILRKFEKTLESLGVKKIDTKDKNFNTENMEAVAMVPGMGDDKKGKVIDCVLTGYTLNDKVIRHAKVAVGQ